jgi:IS30 family transposase
MEGHRAGSRVKNPPPFAGHGAVRNAIATSIATLPAYLRVSAREQGAEMAQHAQLRIAAGLTVYFCDP